VRLHDVEAARGGGGPVRVPGEEPRGRTGAVSGREGVDEGGTPIILEANGNSGVNLLQVHGGLLADPRVRRFFERCGVI